ncbi:unnamed protein product [Dracunculus medinensis]|uniref:UPAR/Ly6 domain-containing protein n=1 Tax=Dracunculus medinensis TaxID=318479 RepID=A0A0N4U968_DRAME|nr:unnamed protein product [Dracunculus medinensis]
MLSSILVVLFASSASAQENICIECASINLKNRWPLTGFSQILRDGSFSTTCASGADTDHSVRCTGPCMTYIFEDPDIEGDSTNKYSESLAVRSYCEYDRDFPRPNSQGKIVFIKMLVDFCEGNSCNSKIKDFQDSAQCLSQVPQCKFIFKIVMVLPIAPIECYFCESDGENCHYAHEQCYKRYCYKSIFDIKGTQSTRKTCADFNPFGMHSGCSTSLVQLVPGNSLKVTGTITQCFCNDKKYCNGTAGISTINLLLYIFITLIICAFSF